MSDTELAKFYAYQPKDRQAAEEILRDWMRRAKVDYVSTDSVGVIVERFFNALFPRGASTAEGAVCKGAWALGTACGRCSRCVEGAREYVEAVQKSRDEMNQVASAQEAEIKNLRVRIIDFTEKLGAKMAPIPMRLTCPSCKQLHVDEGKFATHPHHSHACQTCGNVWRPAIVATVGVRFLPGFKNDE